MAFEHEYTVTAADSDDVECEMAVYTCVIMYFRKQTTSYSLRKTKKNGGI